MVTGVKTDTQELDYVLALFPKWVLFGRNYSFLSQKNDMDLANPSPTCCSFP